MASKKKQNTSNVGVGRNSQGTKSRSQTPTARRTQQKGPYTDLLDRVCAPQGFTLFRRGDLLSIADGQATFVGRVRGLNSNNRYEVDLYHETYGRNFAQIYFDSNRGEWMSHHQHWPVKVELYKAGKKGFDTLRVKMGITIKGPVEIGDDDVPF